MANRAPRDRARVARIPCVACRARPARADRLFPEVAVLCHACMSSAWWALSKAATAPDAPFPFDALISWAFERAAKLSADAERKARRQLEIIEP